MTHILKINGVDISKFHDPIAGRLPIKTTNVDFRTFQPQSMGAIQDAQSANGLDEVIVRRPNGQLVIAIGDGLNLSGVGKSKNAPPAITLDGELVQLVGAPDNEVNTPWEGNRYRLIGYSATTIGTVSTLSYMSGAGLQKHGPNLAALSKSGADFIEDLKAQEEKMRGALSTMKRDLDVLKKAGGELAGDMDDISKTIKAMEAQMTRVDSAIATVQANKWPIVGHFEPFKSLDAVTAETKKLSELATKLNATKSFDRAAKLLPTLQSITSASDALLSIMGEKSERLIKSMQFIAPMARKTSVLLEKAVPFAPKMTSGGRVGLVIAGATFAAGTLVGTFNKTRPLSLQEIAKPY